MANIYSVLSDETLDKIAAGGDLYGSMTDEELDKVIQIEKEEAQASSYNNQGSSYDYSQLWESYKGAFPEPNWGDSIEQDNSPNGVIGKTAPLLTKEDAKAMPSMGASEIAALQAQQQGGPTAYEADGSISNWLGNLWNAISFNSSGKLTAKSTARHNQSILRGTVKKDGKEVPLTELDDDELDYLVDSAGWNGWTGWLGSFVGNRSDNGIMQQWDKTVGAKIADPIKRKAERVKYAQDIARQNIEQQEWEKHAATTELENRSEDFGAGAGAGFITTGSYMLPYLIPHAHGVVAGLIEGGDRAQELMSDVYSVDDDGTIRVAAERDSTGNALLKGAARGAIAPLIERFGGNIAGSAAKNTLGKIPLFKIIEGKVVETTAGKAISKWMNSMNRLGKYTGLHSFPIEMVEEFEDQVLDAGLGLNLRESEKGDSTFLSRAGGAVKEFFKPKNLADLAESMVIMQVLGGGAAYMNDRKLGKHIDNLIVKEGGIAPEELKDYTLEEKLEAYNAFVNGLSEEEIAERFDKGAEAINKLTQAIKEGSAFIDDFEKSAIDSIGTPSVNTETTIEPRRYQQEDILTSKDIAEQGELLPFESAASVAPGTVVVLPDGQTKLRRNERGVAKWQILGGSHDSIALVDSVADQLLANGFRIFNKKNNVATPTQAQPQVQTQEVMNETGHGTNETPAQPEQEGDVLPTEGEETRPVEEGEASAEVGGAVEAPILNGDEIRKTMPGYDPKNWRTHVDRKGDFVAPRMEARFQELLKTRKGKGNGEVVFLAGGNGSGKSTVANALGETLDFIIDSTLGNLAVAKKQIETVIANGQKPVIDFVYRSPEQALEGVVGRVKKGGHAVSPVSFADSHTKGIKNLRLLADEYGDKISIRIFDNSVEGQPEISLKQLEEKGIPDYEELRKRANEVLGQYDGRGLAVESNKSSTSESGGGSESTQSDSKERVEAPTSAPAETTTTNPPTSAESTEGGSRVSDEDSIKNRWKKLKVSERPRPFDLRKSRSNLAERLKNETDITTAKLEEELAQKKSTLETGRLSKRLGSRRKLRAEVQALEEYLASPEEFGKLTMEAPNPPKLRTQAEADAAVVSETQSQMMGDELPVAEQEEILPSEDIANEPDEVANVDVLPTTDLPETEQEKLDNNLNSGKVDNETQTIYNASNNSEAREGVSNDTEQTQESDKESDDELRGLQEEGRTISPERRRLFAEGSVSLDVGERDRFARVLRRRVERKRGNDRSSTWVLTNPKTKEKVSVDKVDGKTFYECFSTCHPFLVRGDQVELHSPEYYENGFGIISSDGLAGFFITESGDAISGYSLQDSSGRGRGFFKTIAPIMKQYAKTADCFHTNKQDLPGFYKNIFGFQTAAILDFNYEIIAADKGTEYADWFVENYGEAPVYFMVNVPHEVTTKHFSKDQYEEAVAYQKQALEGTPQTNKLKNAQGVDPLAAKATRKDGRKRMSEVEKKEALIKRKTLKAKIIYDDLKSNNVKLTSSAFRYSKDNPRGLRLNELYEVAEFDDSAKEYLIEAGLAEEQADELIALVKNAEIAQKLAAPNRADKINEVGQETNAVKASQALTKLAHHPDDLKAIAKAFHAVSAAAETSSRTQDEADYWESKLQEIVALIITLPQESQNKVQYYVREEDNNPENTKNTTHISNSKGENNESLAQIEANVNDINLEESQKIANEAFADKGDATQEAPGGGSMGEGGFTNRKGNRLFTIVKISEDGKTFTVKMQNVGKGDRGEQTVEVPQKALDALAKAEPMWAELAKNPVVGAQVLRSISGETKAERDLRFSNDKDYQKWLKKQKANDAEPLRQRYEAEGLNAAASMVGSFLKGVKTKTVDRDYNSETDGGERFLRDPKTGKVVGTWNRNTNELTLYRGANANTLIHELGGHAAYQFAQQQAEQGDATLLRKMDEAIDYALNNPVFQDFIADVRSRYPDAGEDVLRDEIWAALMERNSPTMEAAIKTLQGKAWYNRAWQAIKDAFKAMLTHMGYNKADLSGIDKMKPEEFISWLDNTMAEGKNLGALEKEKGEGVRNAFINPMTLPNLYPDGSVKQFKEFERIAKRVDKLEEMESMGIDRDTIWQETGLWRGKDGEIRTEVPDIKVSDGFLKYMQLNANVEPTRQLKTVDAESGDNEWLFRLYPEFRTMPITITNIGEGTLGIYRGVKEGILLDRSLLSDPEMFRAVLAHELQHAIQLEEGFSTGTNLESMGGYDDYKRTTGEVEARNVAARLALTPEGREAVPPWETEDVAEDEQIVDYEGGVSLLSREVLNGKETAIISGYPLSIRDARDPEKVLELLSPLIGKSAAQLGEMKLTRITEASIRHLMDSGHARNKRLSSERNSKKLWRGTVAGMSVIDDIIATSPIGKLQQPKHLNAEWKKNAIFYVADTRFAVKFDNGQYEIYPCKLIISEVNGERMVYDLTEIGTPTPTTSVSPKTITVGGPQRGLGANGGVGASAQSISQSEVNSNAEEDSGFRESRIDTTTHTSNHFMDDVRSTKEKLEEKFVDSLAPVKGIIKEIDQIAKARGEEGIEEVVNEDGSTDFINSTDYIAAKDKENGHLERKLRELQQKYIDPAMKSLARAILPKQNKDDLVTDFNLYLQYKHAEARNRKVAEDRGDTYTPDYSEGMGVIRIDGRPPVGLSENVANELLAELERKYGSKMKFFEDAAQSVYNMLEADLVNRNESGLLSDEELQHYMDRRNGSMGWGTYVPLKTDLQKTEGEAYNAFNSGIKRNEFMKAKGRGSLDIADSPFAAAILQAEQGIRRSSRNVLANVEANIAALMNGGFQRNGLTDFSVTKRLGDNENAEPVYAEIVEGEDLSRGGTEFQFVFSNGDRAIASGGSRLVQNRSDIHLFKRDGKLYAIRYVQGANNRGLAVAKSFSGENMGYWGKGMEWLPKFANFLSAMRTQYSPEFMVSNMLSDNLDAFQALVGRYGIWDGSKAFAKAVKNQWKNGRDLAHYLKTGEARGKVKDAIDAGLLTKGGVVSEGIESETVKIRGDISKFIRKQKQWRDMTKGDLVKSFGRNVMDFISMANEFAEYSTRIGISSALEEYGIPRKDAVKFARDATVNFNRKGTAMPYINSLYIFANASVQGAMRSLGAFKDDLSNTKVRSGELGANRKFKGELVGTLVLIGVAKAVIDSLIGDDDEREKQGTNNVTNLTEYDRKHNVGIPIGGGRQVVPLRFRGPYAAIPYLAQTFTRVAMGEITPTRAAEIVASELGDQTTELIGGNGILNDKGEFDGSLFMQSIAPTLIDPFVQIGTGKDYKGDNRLRKRYDETVPLSSNAKRSTPMPYVKLAKIINLLTGGNENRPGRADFAPEDIQLITEFLGGAPWRDINNVISTGQNIAQVAEGGSPEKFLSQMPFVRRVVREYPENTGRYYDAIETYERDKAEYKRTTRLEDRRELKKGKPYLSSEKNYLDKLIDQVNDLSHLENGEVKRGRKWVKAKVERSEKQKEAYRKRRLRLQSRILKTLEG